MIDSSNSTQQLTLDGIEPAVRPTDRLFFALLPPPAVALQIHALAQHLREQQGLKGRPFTKDRFHVTLHVMGDYVGLPEALVKSAQSAASGLRYQPFELSFDRATSFLGRRGKLPFVLLPQEGTELLSGLWGTLRGLLQAAGLVNEQSTQLLNWTPHLTLMYDDRRVMEQAIDSIKWTVNDFALIRSHLSKSRHEVLSRWRF